MTGTDPNPLNIQKVGLSAFTDVATYMFVMTEPIATVSSQQSHFASARGPISYRICFMASLVCPVRLVSLVCLVCLVHKVRLDRVVG